MNKIRTLIIIGMYLLILTSVAKAEDCSQYLAKADDERATADKNWGLSGYADAIYDLERYRACLETNQSNSLYKTVDTNHEAVSTNGIKENDNAGQR